MATLNLLVNNLVPRVFSGLAEGEPERALGAGLIRKAPVNQIQQVGTTTQS